jgi:hypothetical protein
MPDEAAGAPIENSPPGIHTMPAGALPDAVVSASTVGWKSDARADMVKSNAIHNTSGRLE